MSKEVTYANMNIPCSRKYFLKLVAENHMMDDASIMIDFFHGPLNTGLVIPKVSAYFVISFHILTIFRYLNIPISNQNIFSLWWVN